MLQHIKKHYRIYKKINVTLQKTTLCNSLADVRLEGGGEIDGEAETELQSAVFF